MTTLTDVARHAGVAASTVSYVLSGKRPVGEDTQRRVLDSIAVLNYHPHAGARALSSSRSSVLAMFVPLRDVQFVPTTMEIAIGVTTAARDHGYDVLLLTNEEGTDRVLGSARADAAILTDVTMDDDRVPALRAAGVPVVLIGVPADPAGLDCVDLDFAAAGRRCVEHLAGLGHREIALIGQPEVVYRRRVGFAERTLAGVRVAAADAGVSLVHRPCESSFEAAAGVLARVLEERPRTTGMIIQNEMVVLHLLSALRTAGRAVPEDVSIIALCPDQIPEQTSPPLTSVAVPATELGVRAVGALMRRMCEDGAGSTRVELLPPVLTVRESTMTARTG